MSILYQWEPLAALLDDGLTDIVRSHWDEVGIHKDIMPLAPDWDRYRVLEDQHILKVMAARRGEELVGYASFLVMPHLHYNTTMCAHNDAIYVNDSVRGLGIGLIRACERDLAKLASPRWLRITYHSKMHVEAGRGTLALVFNKLGYHAFEHIHDKMVRAE